MGGEIYVCVYMCVSISTPSSCSACMSFDEGMYLNVYIYINIFTCICMYPFLMWCVYETQRTSLHYDLYVDNRSCGVCM